MRSSRSERVAAWMLTVVLLLGCGAWWWRQERAAQASSQSLREQEPLLAEQPEESARAVALPPSLILVHVKGAVRFPGVYELPEGARVIDAVEAAGGATADGLPHALNLAARLADGEPVEVPTAREHASGTWAPAAPSAPTRVNINTAGSALLQTLPGIGPVKANAIIQHRRDHGPFSSIEELTRVNGIGPATLEKIRDLITVR